MRRCAILAVALFIAAAATVGVDAKRPKWHDLEKAEYTFDMYRRDFKKPYQPGDEGFETRKANFEANLAHIRAHNADKTQTWRAGLNMFSDMSRAEFKKYNRAGPTPPEWRQFASKVHTAPGDNEKLPIEVDWRSATTPRVLTAVKHQGACGSCWAHSAVESMEAQYALLTGMLPVLSVGQVNSCTPSTGEYMSSGCDGGRAVGAWLYLMNKTIDRPDILKSVTENWVYPIPVKDWFFDDQPTGYTTSACVDTSKNWVNPATSWFAELTAVGVSGFGAVDSNSPTGSAAAMKALRDVGPLSIGVAAGNWQWYESGVMKNNASNGADNEWSIDHDVQMVGYGYDKELDLNYWIVRNSWSTLWGEDGFIRLWRSKDGEPEPCDNTPFGTVCGTSGCISDMHYPIVYEATPTKFG